MLGYVPPLLPRFLRRQQEREDLRKIGRILEETGEVPENVGAGATAAGDAARLRGIPAIGRGCSGAIRDTDPVRSLLAKEARGERRR